ncbi:hypothetical protein B0H17DRAFT_1217292 [Mycena rosella]|uniref:Origin recognition complex subunit 3 winged helix C-terminal domain-containing protein n=1 Tax=Mycena rosella TaxID=1033263 RepID=A0AAD7C0G2_MYCRO|nr:hypothetical protein B0H17DRAFT_1217292 [Mycena rosella]
MRQRRTAAPYNLGLLQAWYDAVDDVEHVLHDARIALLELVEEHDEHGAGISHLCPLALDAPAILLPTGVANPLDSIIAQSIPLLLHPKLTINTPQTFFDPAVELLLPGPTLLEFIETHYATHTPSLDALLSILQVAHLKHLSTDPSSLLSHTTRRIAPAPSARELRFLEALLVRVARGAFARHARGTKLGFRLLHIVVAFLRARAATEKLLERWRGAAAVSQALDGDGVGNSPAALEALLGELHVYLHGLPHAIRVAEMQARSTLVSFRNPSSEQRDKVAGWRPENSTPLWMWYTGYAPFPSELMQANQPGTAPVHHLAYTSPDDEEEEEKNLQDLRDTSILFKGYTKAGKMIDVYDWFDNFRIVVKGQRESALSTPAKGNGKGKGKDKKKKAATEGDEKWKLGVQAQFMRALHELDYLGFIKHTSHGGRGRKGDMYCGRCWAL